MTKMILWLGAAGLASLLAGCAGFGPVGYQSDEAGPGMYAPSFGNFNNYGGDGGFEEGFGGFGGGNFGGFGGGDDD